MVEMRVMAVVVMTLVMTRELPTWNVTLGSKTVMSTLFTTCHQRLQIATGATLQGKI
jgi:hypothetical protein